MSSAHRDTGRVVAFSDGVFAIAGRTIAARALKPQYRDLFTVAELKKYCERLAAYKWTHEPPWSPPGV